MERGGTNTVFDWTTYTNVVTTSSYYGGGANGEWLGTLKNGHAGFVSTSGSATDLGHTGIVYGLNAQGQAVGTYTDASGHQFGFYWTSATEIRRPQHAHRSNPWNHDRRRQSH